MRLRLAFASAPLGELLTLPRRTAGYDDNDADDDDDDDDGDKIIHFTVPMQQ